VLTKVSRPASAPVHYTYETEYEWPPQTSPGETVVPHEHICLKTIEVEGAASWSFGYGFHTGFTFHTQNGVFPQTGLPRPLESVAGPLGEVALAGTRVVGVVGFAVSASGATTTAVGPGG